MRLGDLLEAQPQAPRSHSYSSATRWERVAAQSLKGGSAKPTDLLRRLGPWTGFVYSEAQHQPVVG
jgi:hypothetical protein